MNRVQQCSGVTSSELDELLAVGEPHERREVAAVRSHRVRAAAFARQVRKVVVDGLRDGHFWLLLMGLLWLWLCIHEALCGRPA